MTTPLTPHVRKGPRRKVPRMSGPRYFNLMRAIERAQDLGTGEYADYRSTTYCGAPLTTEDWDRRTACAAKHAALVVEQGVCPDCLRLAREDAAVSA